MKLVTYNKHGQIKIGAIVEGGVIDLVAAAHQADVESQDAFPQDMMALLHSGERGLAMVKTAVAHAQQSGADFLSDPDDITFLPPIPRPGKILCLGRNYAAHAKEGGAEPPKFPMLFYKPATALLGHRGSIIIPPISDKIDYEAELAVVIGKNCKQVPEDEALDYVAGYTIANDVTARDIQRRTSQFTSGKMLDTFGPMGPALVTRDEIPDPGSLAIRSILNGRVMQNDTTSNMIFTIPFIISYISQLVTLEVGDIILTGTPEGVGFPRKPPVFMQEGDHIKVEIEGLGVLENILKKQ